MNIITASDMARFLKAAIEGEDSDEVFERLDKIKVGPCPVNTFTVKDEVTGNSYLVTVKAVK